MNKDVVYIEPEDDITDIIARIKSAKQKLVALVPPKKIGVLRSAVNTKLIAKAARSTDKVVVIVTMDPALIKLAATAKIPVAKTLQSRPKLPSEIVEDTKDSSEQVINESDFSDDEAGEIKSIEKGSGSTSSQTNSPDQNAKKTKPGSSKQGSLDQSFSSDDLEKDEKKSEKDGKKDKKGKIPTLEKYRKWIIAGSVAFVLLVVFLVWAFVFAPAANISVAIRTTTNNFSENVSFVTKAGTEKTSDGIFLLEQKKVEKSSSVEFDATGQKDIGTKATGTINLVANFVGADMADVTISVPAGSVFYQGDYRFVTTSAVNFRVDDECTVSKLRSGDCNIQASVSAEAIEAGDKYNIGAHSSGEWSSTIDHVSASNSAPFSGGTTNIITVVSEQDFNNAKSKLENQGREDGKADLLKEFGSDMTIIESSLEISTSNPVSSPAVGEEVKSGVKPKVEATTTYVMYAVDKTVVSDYIKGKAEKDLAADQKIYAVDTPFFENFTKTDDKYTAKLKGSTQTGPKVTEETIMEKARGKKVGEVQSLLKSINGVSSVTVKTSFPWVGSVPDDPNKVTIELKVEE